MSMAELMESITDELTEQLEHGVFAQYMNPLENPDGLKDCRCIKCNRLLGKFNGQAEIKCPKCGKINRIGVER